MKKQQNPSSQSVPGSLIILLIMFGVIGFLALISIPWISDIMLQLFIFRILIIGLVIFRIFTIIFMPLWFSRRHDPSAHKTRLIITDVLGLFLVWCIPGLLVMISGAIAPSETA